RMLDYHRDTAHKEIEEGLNILEKRVHQQKQKLILQSALLAGSKSIVASLKRVNKGSGPKNYNGILLDQDKWEIVGRLRSVVKAQKEVEIFVYDQRGELIAFAATDSSQPIEGIVSYSRDAPSILQRKSKIERWKGDSAGLFLEQWGRQELEGSAIQQRPGALLLKNNYPIEQKYADGRVHIGTIVVATLLDEAYISTLSYPPLSFGILDEKAVTIVGRTFLRSMSLIKREQFLMHNQEGILFFHLNDAFLGSRVMPLGEQGEVLHLLARYPLENYLAASERTRRAVLTAVVVIALIVFPLGLLLLQYYINTPLRQLMSGVRRLQKGDYEERVELKASGELGELATALNTLAGGIRERERDLSAIIDQIPLMLYVKSAKDLRFVKLNRAGEALLGKSRSELIGLNDYDHLPAEQADLLVEEDRQVLSSGVVRDIAEEFIDTPQGLRTLHTRKVPIVDSDGCPCYLLGLSEDITEQKEAEEHLRQWAKVFDSTSEAIVITDLDANILDVNHAFSQISGYQKVEVEGENARIMKSGRQDRDFYIGMWQSLLGKGSWQGEIWNKRKSGELYPAWQTISTVYDDDEKKATHYISVFSDITAIKRAQDELNFLAHHDPLTRLPNRLLLKDRMQHAIDRASREESQVAVMFLDLDHFKNINDTLGHPVGDQLLLMVSERLRSILREVDTLSRQGGDEFILVLEGAEDLPSVLFVVNKILELFELPFNIAEKELRITVSLGVSLYPCDGRDSNTLIRNADSAMYKAKENGRNQFWFYTEELTQRAVQRVDMEQALRNVVSSGELELHYQPQVALPEATIVGAEALVRWNRPGYPQVMPDSFIPVAEATGLINEIGEWVLRQGCQQMAQWLDQGLSIERVAINVSPVQLRLGNLPELVEELLQEFALSPHHLELEVTEAVFMADRNQMKRELQKLHSLGVQLALDDFGTGFSSLSYLKNFHFDRIKIDRSFTQNILEIESNQSIANAIITLGQSFNMSVIAEGIETHQALEWLSEKGCDEGQGYLFARPLTVSDFSTLLQEEAGGSAGSPLGESHEPPAV
ncbi:MAG: EAL domain-containing protein, partial [Gammaproteobacteria bacterium]|nr:EAL domain-containing protein [Gammaproteobacteria bacterium]